MKKLFVKFITDELVLCSSICFYGKWWLDWKFCSAVVEDIWRFLLPNSSLMYLVVVLWYQFKNLIDFSWILMISIFFKMVSHNFYFLFTIVMKVLISCTEKPNFFIEVLDKLEFFIDKKCFLPSVGKCCNPHNVTWVLWFLRLPGLIPSGSPHTNFWLLYTFKVLNILFFGKIFF
jgi:hypothetical protein